MENEPNQTQPLPKYCFAVRHHKIFCVPCDRNECFRSHLLEAESSDFHPEPLAEATRAINEILSGLQPGSPDQSLALIQTGMGIMLTWVTPEHDSTSTKDKTKEEIGVTTEDGLDAIAKALKIKPAQG